MAESSDQSWSRRDLGRVILVGALGPVVARQSLGGGAGAMAGPAVDSPLAEFVRALDPERRARLVLRADDPRRGMVQNHWAVVPEPIAALTAHQQERALALIRQVLTEPAFDRWTRQRDDDAAGWRHDHLAVFADEEGARPAEWVVTGRHLTLRGRADGSVPGGPLFWGHTATDPFSLGHGVMDAAEALHERLTPDERRRATVDARSGRSLDSGLALATLDAAGQGAARRLVAILTEPFRWFRVPTVRATLDGPGTLAAIRWQAFGAENAPLAVWRLVGPGFRWSVHTEPHFHTWFESS